MTALLWFRRDLRLHDHPALRAALGHERVIPVFCFDERLLAGRHASPARIRFLLECLVDVDGSLRELGSGLVVRRGDPARELAELASATGAGEVHASGDVGPFAAARDARSAAALAEVGVRLRLHPGVSVVEDVSVIRTGQGGPFTVFTPFYRRWLAVERRPVTAAPSSLPGLPARLARARLPTVASLGVDRSAAGAMLGGERAGRARLARFLKDGVAGYQRDHDMPGVEGTSRLSPYLHFGCVSPREIEQRLPRGPGAELFHRQLCWRDFFHHVLHHFPENQRREFQVRYRGTLRWSRAEQRFEAWCEGRTGYPLVDAGMRQLAAEGWMHNRVRMVVGSFLTKDLGIDWRWGEQHFMRLLLDGDEANNNGNWQWIASVGVDPQPVFKRILSPTRQLRRFDPDGTYVRCYVPELAQVPDEYLPEPWRMPSALQHEVGCVIARDYPAPILDHAAARTEALDRYRTAAEDS
jgi:deoxyribodipyrimidine photo-lyase